VVQEEAAITSSFLDRGLGSTGSPTNLAWPDPGSSGNEIVGMAADACRSRRDLVIENVRLRMTTWRFDEVPGLLDNVEQS
jgi:hypothetical protein